MTGIAHQRDAQEAEFAIIATLLNHPECIPLVTLPYHAFTNNTCAFVLRALRAIDQSGETPDAIAAATWLRDRDRLAAAGGPEAIADVAMYVGVPSNLDAYVRAAENAARHRLIDRLGIQTRSLEGSSLERLVALQGMVRQIEELGADESSVKPIGEYRGDVMERLDKMIEAGGSIAGLTTGIPALDRKTGGLDKGAFWVVAGRPSMGKTAFALNIMLAAGQADEGPVLMFSAEMTGRALAQRMASIVGRIPAGSFKDPNISNDTCVQIDDAMTTLSGLDIHFDTTSSPSIQQMKARAMALGNRCGRPVSLIVLDYLQLATAPEGERYSTEYEEASRVSKGCKAIAKDLDVPFLALAQLNRKVEERSNRRPIMADLRASGQIEQDADVVAFLYRDEVYNEPTPQSAGVCEIILDKQREGTVGTVLTLFDGKYQKFGAHTGVYEPAKGSYGRSIMEMAAQAAGG